MEQLPLRLWVLIQARKKNDFFPHGLWVRVATAAIEGFMVKMRDGMRW